MANNKKPVEPKPLDGVPFDPRWLAVPPSEPVIGEDGEAGDHGPQHTHSPGM